MVFSCVLSSTSVQRTRRLLSKDEKSSMQTSLVQGALKFRNREEIFETGEEFMVKERMNLEIADYPGTGANNRHDPKAPGRV
ncbi:hypothetical protein SESBI_17117 [Sesbania bispinosa]|nr:hypothetical protein SESBI_17117 [Sesbania bispinosa]